MKNLIVVTGGAGFIGSNLIEKILITEKNFKIISIDNYSTGNKKNHIKDNRVIYYKSHTRHIEKILKNKINKIHSLFHFGRICKNFSKLF